MSLAGPLRIFETACFTFQQSSHLPSRRARLRYLYRPSRHLLYASPLYSERADIDSITDPAIYRSTPRAALRLTPAAVHLLRLPFKSRRLLLAHVSASHGATHALRHRQLVAHACRVHEGTKGVLTSAATATARHEGIAAAATVAAEAAAAAVAATA